MNRTGARVAGVLVAVLLVAATACGGGSSNDESSEDAKVSATVASGSSSGSGSDSSDDTTTDASDLSELMDGLGGDCMQAGLAYFALSMSALGAAFGSDAADIAEMQSSIDELKTEIPSEIEDDFNTFADALEQYADAMQGISMEDMLNGSSQAEDAAKLLETPEVTEAQANLDAYFEQNCPS